MLISPIAALRGLPPTATSNFKTPTTRTVGSIRGTLRAESGRPRALTRFLTLALLAGATIVGCSQPEPPPTAPNILLISIDTLRADHLGCYGYEPPTSPEVDAFRRDAVLFATAIAQAPSTLHSHASILTSLLPHHHGASWGAKRRLADEVVSVAEVLQDAGYETAAFTGGGQMDKAFGLDQGFGTYDQPGVHTFDKTVERALGWLQKERQGTAPFFPFLHSYEPHHPYDPPADLLALFDGDYDGPLPPQIEIETLRAINQDELEIDDEDLAHIVAAYDGEIRSMDRGFGQLIEALRAGGLYDESLIVFTSDHGEEFGEHGRVGWHSHSLYDELLAVPLVIKFPGGTFAGATVNGQVRSIDIPPTMLAAAGLAAPRQFLGVDLAPLAASQAATTGLSAVSRIDRRATRDISALRTEKWKLYSPWLFDLEIDPGEQWDTATSHLDEVAALEAALEEAIAERRRSVGPQVAPTKKNLEELKALGYLE